MSASRWVLPVFLCACPAAPAEIEQGTIEAVQLNGGNTNASIQLSPGHATSPGVSVNHTLSDSGDYVLDFSPANDLAAGVLMTTVAESGRDNSAAGGPAGTFYPTSSIAGSATEYFIPVHRPALNSSVEFNINVAFGYFPFADWLGGVASNSTDGGPINSLVASPGIDIDAEFVDNGGGGYTLNIAAMGGNSQTGILLVNGAKNENNYALSRANASATFTLYTRDNGAQGGTYERDPVAFVYIPASHGSEQIVAMGRINGDASADVTSGSYTVTKGPVGTWYLSIPGHSHQTGTLLVSPEGGATANTDNSICYEWDDTNDRWIIESRDLPEQTLQDTAAAEDTFSFAFLVTPASTLFVDASATGTNNGQSWANAFTNLQSALTTATTGDTILVAEGLYKPGASRSDSFVLVDGVKTYGGFPAGGGTFQLRDPSAHPTIFSGDIAGNDSQTPVATDQFTLTNANENTYNIVVGDGLGSGTVLDGFTITAGSAAGPDSNTQRGGGIRLINSSPTLTNLVLTGNFGQDRGGALYKSGGSPALEAVQFIGNRAGSNAGGGMYTTGGGTPRITNSVFIRNHCFQFNQGAGGIHIQDNCNLTNVLFVGNTARGSSGSGGAIRIVGGSPVLTNVTVAGNDAATGGAIRVQFGVPLLTNCIIWGNTATTDPGLTGDPIDPASSNNIIQGQPGAVDPLFVRIPDPGDGNWSTAANNDYGDLRLRINSPAINAGDNAANLTATDIDGAARIVHTTIDLGAYEMPTPPWFVDQNATGANTGETWDDAFTDLQSALATAVHGEEIWVAQGTYKPTTGTSRGIYFLITQEIGLYGGFPSGGSIFAARDPATHATVLSGEINTAATTDNSFHVVVIAPALPSCVIDGFTITGGYADSTGNSGRGGGIFVENDAAAIFRKLIVTGNYAVNDGGAVMVETGGTAVPVFENVTFHANTSGDAGGAIYNWARSPQYTNCSFTNNLAGGQGGAIFNNTSTSPITGCLFTGNNSVGGGGAIYNSASSLGIVNCRFQNNDTTGVFNGVATGVAGIGGDAPGGAVHHASGDLALTNCSFIANNCTGGTGRGGNVPTNLNNGTGGRALGGGLAHAGGTVIATNCLFAKNIATGGRGEGGDNTGLGPDGDGIAGPALGGGFYTAAGDNATIVNCTFSENQARRGTASSFNNGSQVFQRCQGGAADVAAGTATVRNSISWNNRANLNTQSTQTLISEITGINPGSPNIIAGGTGTPTPTGTNPLFVNPGANNFHLQAGSPAVGAGSNSAIPAGVTTDLDGKPRLVPTTVDLGCYESNELNLRPAAVNLGKGYVCNDDCMDWIQGGGGLTASFTLAGTAGDITFLRPPTLLPNGDLDVAIAPGTSGSAWFEVTLSDPGGTYTGMPTAVFSITNEVPPSSAVPVGLAFDFTATTPGPIGGGLATARIRGYLQPAGTRKGLAILPGGFAANVPAFDPPQDDVGNASLEIKADSPNELPFYARGYDIYTVSWHDPRTYVDRNAMVLAEMLQLLVTTGLDRGAAGIDTLAPAEKVIVHGGSMGGLVSRFGLCYLDTLALPYRCDLFISFDSPQEGAYIPIGLQYFAQWMKGLGSDYAGGFDNALLNSSTDAMDQPAPKQMLLLHHSRADNPSNPNHAAERTTFVNTLRDTYGDWPANPNLRMVAIANGAGDGFYEEFENTDNPAGESFAPVKFSLPKPGGEYRILDWRSKTHESYDKTETKSYEVLGVTLWKARFRTRAEGWVNATAWAQRISAGGENVFKGEPSARIHITDERPSGDDSYQDVTDGTLVVDMGGTNAQIRAQIREFLKDQLNVPGVVPDSIIDPILNAMIDEFASDIYDLKDYAQTNTVVSNELWDWVPGGLRDTGAGMTGALADEGTIAHVSNRHCFIPTVSALAISGTYSASGAPLPDDAELDSPFDSIYHYGTFSNRSHVSDGEGWVTDVIKHELRRLEGKFLLEVRHDPEPFYYSWFGRAILESSANLAAGSWTRLLDRTNGIYRPAPASLRGFFRLRMPSAYVNGSSP